MGAYDEPIDDKSAESEFVEIDTTVLEYQLNVVCFLFIVILNIYLYICTMLLEQIKGFCHGITKISSYIMAFLKMFI